MLEAAKSNFKANYDDVKRLIEIHGEMTGGRQGRPPNLEPINKAIIISLCACWEVYVEDVCKEGISVLVNLLNDPELLSSELKARIGDRILNEKPGSPLRLWNLAGDRWKDIAVNFVSELCNSMHAPASKTVIKSVEIVFGIKDISTHWTWQKMEPKRACAKLDDLVKLRGSLAHGKVPENGVNRWVTSQFNAHIPRLVGATNDAIVEHLKNLRAEGSPHA